MHFRLVVVSRPLALTAAALLLSGGIAVVPGRVFAQDRSAEDASAEDRVDDRDDLGDGGAVSGTEDRTRIEDLVRSLTNNRVIARNDDEIRTRLGVLLESRNPYARRMLRAMLANSGAPETVIRQLGSAILFGSSASDLIPDVIERLRVERDSDLARSFDRPLLRYAGSELVGAVAALAREQSRSIGFRVTAVRVLGTTAHTEALPVLAEIWADPDEVLRVEAAGAFIQIVPFVRSRDEALSVLVEMNEYGTPLAEVLRRRLRETEAFLSEREQQDYLREYVEMAEAALAHLPLSDVLTLYLDSPVSVLRGAAAKRLREFDWGAEADPALARIGAGTALLETLRREEDAGVESVILAALSPLARHLRDHVARDATDTLMVRARESGGATRDVRLAAIALLGALQLRDPRPVEMLQSEFDELGDTDPDLRIAILQALSSIAVDLTGWLRERMLAEDYDRVAQAMAVELARANDPGAIDVFEQLLARPHANEIVRNTASTGLKLLWKERGLVAARDVLIRYGLNDESVTVRENSAIGLRARPSDDPALLVALQVVVARPDEDPRVRKAAAESILDLDPERSLERLGSALADGPIWEVYRDRRIDALRAKRIDSTDILGEADKLWSMADGTLRDRAVELLQAVVDAGDGLWDGPEGRGLIHERLAMRLLESGRPEDACQVAEALLSEDLRADDPQYRWRLLLARSLRACGAQDALARAAAQLTSMRVAEELPPALRSPVLLELGETLLQLDDPTGARETLAMIGDAPDLTRAQQARRDELVALAEQGSDEEQRLVIDLLDRIATPEARAHLDELGFRAARHVHAALVNETDLVALRRILSAVEVITGKTFGVSDAATPEERAVVTAQARAALIERIERGAARPDGR